MMEEDKINSELGGNVGRNGRARGDEGDWSLGRLHVGGHLLPRLHELRIRGGGGRELRRQMAPTRDGGTL